jgi:hypothetical protein
VMATIALFVALGGAAYATHPGGANTIDSIDIINGQVKTADLGNSAVSNAKLANASVATAKIADGGVTARKLGCSGNNASDVMVKAGSVCIDKYENSIWDAPTGGNQITGAIPCNINGQNCTNIYARSVAGVTPRADISWLQAQQALANSGKRLPTNAEWQQAVAGTPDSTACNISTGAVQNTGANAGCVSRFGANDMVGNLWEMVADWDEEAEAAAAFYPPGDFGTDWIGVGKGSGQASTHHPAPLQRGGNFTNAQLGGSDGGPFAVKAQDRLMDAFNGFRGAR